jgi:hypothetical protein
MAKGTDKDTAVAEMTGVNTSGTVAGAWGALIASTKKK